MKAIDHIEEPLTDGDGITLKFYTGLIRSSMNIQTAENSGNMGQTVTSEYTLSLTSGDTIGIIFDAGNATADTTLTGNSNLNQYLFSKIA